MSQLKGKVFVPIPLGGFGLIKREVRWLYESAKWKDGQTDSEVSLGCPCFSCLFMTGHNGQSNTLSLVAFCCLCTILSFSLWASIQLKCHVLFLWWIDVCSLRVLQTGLHILCSTHMWGSVLLICSYLYRCVWFKVVYLWVCVSLLIFIHLYFLLSGAAAVMELSRGEVPLYVSLTEQSSFFPPSFFPLFLLFWFLFLFF